VTHIFTIYLISSEEFLPFQQQTLLDRPTKNLKAHINSQKKEHIFQIKSKVFKP